MPTARARISAADVVAAAAAAAASGGLPPGGCFGAAAIASGAGATRSTAAGLTAAGLAAAGVEGVASCGGHRATGRGATVVSPAYRRTRLLTVGIALESTAGLRAAAGLCAAAATAALEVRLPLPGAGFEATPPALSAGAAGGVFLLAAVAPDLRLELEGVAGSFFTATAAAFLSGLLASSAVSGVRAVLRGPAYEHRPGFDDVSIVGQRTRFLVNCRTSLQVCVAPEGFLVLRREPCRDAPAASLCFDAGACRAHDHAFRR